MRILLVNYEFPPAGGGAGNATLFMARALVGLGHEPTVLTGAVGGEPASSLVDGIRVIRVRPRRGAADRASIGDIAGFLAAAFFRAPAIARDCRAEGVVTFFTIPSGPAGWLLNRLKGLPYVVSLRGGDVPGHVPGIQAFHRVTKPLRRAVLRRARAVVANAPGLARRSEGVDPVPVQVIPNGVDSDYFRPAGPGERAEGFRILFVGRLHEEKNVELLLHAAARVHAAGVDLHVDLVGDGAMRPALEELARDLGIAARVAWHGWLPKDQVAPLYRRATCLVNPSRYEGMPNTVLEAMASGLPVVASDVGGNNDLVVHEGSGFLFELPGVEAMAAALNALAASPALAQRMGALGREIVVSGYSWQSVAGRYVELLSPECRAAGSGAGLERPRTA